MDGQGQGEVEKKEREVWFWWRKWGYGGERLRDREKYESLSLFGERGWMRNTRKRKPQQQTKHIHAQRHTLVFLLAVKKKKETFTKYYGWTQSSKEHRYK